MTDSADKKPRDGVTAVDRALALLATFNDDNPRQTLAQLSAATGLYKSTVLRLTASLEAANYLRREADKSFVLGPELMRLGTLYQRSLRLEEPVRTVLRELIAATGESASFFQRNGDKRLCLFREDSAHSIRDHVREGDLLPMQSGAASRVLKAFDDRIASDTRYKKLAELPVTSFGERDAETASASVPVFGPNDSLLGALTVSGPLVRLTEEKIKQLTPQLIDAGKRLSVSLGGANMVRAI